MRVRVLLFAMLRERLGQRELEMKLPEGATVASLVEQLGKQYPGLRLRDLPLAVAVNQEYAAATHPLADGDEVALIPPVSGGGL